MDDPVKLRRVVGLPAIARKPSPRAPDHYLAGRRGGLLPRVLPDEPGRGRARLSRYGPMEKPAHVVADMLKLRTESTAEIESENVTPVYTRRIQCGQAHASVIGLGDMELRPRIGGPLRVQDEILPGGALRGSCGQARGLRLFHLKIGCPVLARLGARTRSAGREPVVLADTTSLSPDVLKSHWAFLDHLELSRDILHDISLHQVRWETFERE